MYMEAGEVQCTNRKTEGTGEGFRGGSSQILNTKKGKTGGLGEWGLGAGGGGRETLRPRNLCLSR